MGGGHAAAHPGTLRAGGRHCQAALQHHGLQGRQAGEPVLAVALERGGVAVGLRFFDETLVARIDHWGHRLTGRQCVVNLAPALHDVGGAPTVHDQVVKLDRQAMQAVVRPQQGEPPRRLRVQYKWVLDGGVPPVAHGLSRVGGITQFDHRQRGLEAGQQALVTL
jgi:hypothetical protein